MEKDYADRTRELADAQADEVAVLRGELELERTSQAEKVREAVSQQLAQTKDQERQRIELEYSKKDQAVRATVRKLEEQNNELTRRVERLSAGERGEFNEVDIHAQLQRAFPGDDITKTRRGQRGADIFQEVRLRTPDGPARAGLIVYECKDTLKWNNAFIGQAKTAAKDHKTPFVVLVTAAFPPNEKSLVVKDGVIVVDPARCVALAGIVRRMVVEIYYSGQLAGSRAEKTEALYSYISSTEFRQTFDALSVDSESLNELLEKERRGHERIWAQREHLYRDIGDAVSRISSQFDVILQKKLREGN